MALACLSPPSDQRCCGATAQCSLPRRAQGRHQPVFQCQIVGRVHTRSGTRLQVGLVLALAVLTAVLTLLRNDCTGCVCVFSGVRDHDHEAGVEACGAEAEVERMPSRKVCGPGEHEREGRPGDGSVAALPLRSGGRV